MKPALLAAAACSAVLLSGCGGGAGGAPAADVTRSLQGDVALVTAAARAGDGAKARAALASLRAHVAAFEKDGRLSPVRADRVRAAAGQLEPDLPAISTVTAPPTRPSTPTDPTPKRKGHGHDEGGGSKDD